jgi:drug/metabolite transporter (DMT)-like permease
MITGVMAHVWLRETALSPARITGLLLGIAGLAVMLIGSRSLGPGAAVGIAGMLLSVTAYSASTIAIKHIGADIPALATTIGGLAVTLPLLLVMYALTGEPLPNHVPPRAALSIVYLGVIGSVLGFAMYYYVLRQVEATRVALITLVTPVIALMLGNLLNGESIHREVWIGTATILAGLLLFEYGQGVNGWKPRLQALRLGRTPAP